MRTRRTKIFRQNGKLVTEIPIFIMPRVTKPILKPGIEVQTTSWIYLMTGGRAKNGSIPVHTPIWLLTQIGFDYTKRIQLRMYRYPVWFQSHYYHGLPSGRAWIPIDAVRRMNIQPHTQYAFMIRGWTPSEYKITREITITHLDREYTTDQRRWKIPELTGAYMGVDVKPEEIFGWAVDSGYDILAQWYYEQQGRVTVDFIIAPDSQMMAKSVARRNNLAFRHMLLKNYSASVELDYAFLTELRVTYLSPYPVNNYLIMEDEYREMMESLLITIENIVNFWFQFKDEGSHLRYAEKKEKVKSIVTGEEDKVPVSFGEVAEFPFNFADKYVRIVAHDDEYEYYDDRISRDLQGKVLPDGRMVIVDRNGFVWLR